MSAVTSAIALGALVAAGCANAPRHGGGNDLGASGDMTTRAADLAPPADLTDVTPLPAPVTKHVGATGTTCCLATAGAVAAAYLLSPAAGSPGTGELHVTQKDGSDKKVDSGVAVGGFQPSLDGKAILYTKPNGKNADLYWADLTAATVAPKTLFTATVPSPVLAQAGLLSPSGNYFLVGVRAPAVAVSPDLHVIDLRTGSDVFQRINGAFAYIQVVLPDDTLFFQDTAGGQSTGSPPVQTLYWVKLPSGTPASINTRTSQLAPTADNRTLVYLRSNGDLYAWDIAAASGAGTLLASGVVKFAAGASPKGPIVYLAADGSVHVTDTSAAKLLDGAASMATSFRAPILLSGDGADAYFFQNGDLVSGGVQNNQGTLMHVAVRAGATPSKVADKVSIKDVQITDSALLFLQNVDGTGTFGDAARANRDGSNVTALGTLAVVGGLAVVNPGPQTWFVLHLAGAARDGAHTPIDASLAITGRLAWADSLGGSEITVDAAAHAGAFAFSDDGRDVVFVGAVAWSGAAANFAGKLSFLATRAPSQNLDGNLAGVTELGPVVSRALFVNAPGATPAGVYFVSY